MLERTWVPVSGAQPQYVPVISDQQRLSGRGSIAYDAVRHQTVLLVPGNPSQTWVFDGATRRWSQKFPTTSPSLMFATAAFDAEQGVVVVVGFDEPVDSCWGPAATWTWDGETWTRLHPIDSPDECHALSRSPMAYDAARHRVMLVNTFGGHDATWLWDGTNWTDAGPVPTPHHAAIAYDPVSRRVLAFGGYVGDNNSNDTYAWNGKTWVLLSAGGSPHDPKPRSGAAMTFDPVMNAVVMFGGDVHHWVPRPPPQPVTQTFTPFNDTWRWANTHWVRMGTASSPPPMSDVSLVYDTDHRMSVLFGNETWLLTAAQAGGGYLLCASDGGVFTFGDAHYYGSTGGKHLNRPIIGMARTVTRKGYWLAARDGGVFTFGDARYYGSTGGTHLNQPIVALTATPSGLGYRLVARDGGIFTFGDARYYGSTGNIPLNQPVVGMAPTPTGDGYWLVARDGGIFTFGDAHYYGSTGGRHLNQPVVAMAATPKGDGYWLAARDGSVFAFGAARFAGSYSAPRPVVAIDASPTGHGYWLITDTGAVKAFGDAQTHGNLTNRLRSPIVSGTTT